MNRRILALLVSGAALTAAAPAFATDMDSYYAGVHAWSHGSNGQLAVSDTKADSQEVYANYARSGQGSGELRNSSGSGTTVYSGTDTAHYVTKIQACVAIDFFPDSCTGWTYR
ncbi:hypothetical protein [Kitasatospora sp. NPDC085879]|uniref:hypothetical protein n=1 Tax=Kitasatospora sp. NPDC085879 TaxID=3154769 RepID=UPI0034304114